MDSILDNQEVTTDILNDIAIDLGASTFNNFTGTKFGVDELNGITQALVTKGILQVGNECKPVLSGENIIIQDGIIIFSNGAKKKIEDFVTLNKIDNSYIYALNDTAQNKISVVISQTEPTTEDFVMLAKIENNNLLDKRTYSLSKVELLSGNFSVTKTILLDISKNMTQFADFGYGGFKYLLYNSNNPYWVDLSDNQEHIIFIGTNDTYVQKSGTGLLFKGKSNTVSGSYEFTVI